MWQRRTFREAGQDQLELPRCVNVNYNHLTSHPLIINLLKICSSKVSFEIKEVNKIMGYGVYVYVFLLV